MRRLLIPVVLVALATFAHAETGLDFPGNRGGGGSTYQFKFANPQSNGLPAWGPGGNGVTLIWKAYTKQEPFPSPCNNDTDRPFYTTMFWGNDGGFQPGNATWGFHPYPRDGHYCSDGGKLYWEIATAGGDYLDTNEDLISPFNTWRWQVARVWGGSGQSKHTEYVWDWLNGYNGSTISSAYEISVTLSSYGDSNPSSPVLAFGDAPWNEGNEIYYGVLRGFMIFSTQLSDADVETIIQNAEAGGSTPWTSCGTACTNNVWYANINPTPTDISDHSGRGHNPAWDGSNRPGLWQGSTPQDTTPPSIVSAEASGDPNLVEVTFSEPVEESSAEAVANYGLDHGISITSAVLQPDAETVLLSTSSLTDGVTYTLTVNNVRDVASPPNTIASNTQVVFTYDSGLPDVPPAPGSLTVN